MKKASAIISLMGIGAPTAVTLLSWWGFASHRAFSAASKDFPYDASPRVATLQGKLVYSIASEFIRNETVPPQDLSTLPSVIDEELRQLEQEIHRAAQIADTDARHKVLSDACVRWAAYDPADAINWLRRLGLDQVSNTMVEDIVQKWATTDFQRRLDGQIVKPKERSGIW